MLSVTRYTQRAPSDWKTPLAVVGAVTAGVIGAKLLRQALIWAQFTLVPPVVVKYAGEWALVTGGKPRQAASIKPQSWEGYYMFTSNMCMHASQNFDSLLIILSV